MHPWRGGFALVVAVAQVLIVLRLTTNGYFPIGWRALVCDAARGLPMPIYELLQRHGVFTPEELTVLSNVFEDVLGTLGLVDRKDSMTELVAKKVIELATAGILEPNRLRALTLGAFTQEEQPPQTKRAL
jgi:hypothetical protein